MTRKTVIKAGETVRILWRFSDSMARGYHFTARPLDGGAPRGVVAIHGSRWLMRKPEANQPLAAENMVEKGMWDTIFSIYVTPEQDTEITLTARITTPIWLWLIAGLVVVAALSAFLVPVILGR